MGGQNLNHPPEELNPQSHLSSISENSQTSSKIPIRPQKTRKLASDAVAAPADSTTDEKPAQVSDEAAIAAKSRRRKNPQPIRALPGIMKPLSSEGEIDRALRHLRNSDPLLADLIDSLPPPTFESHHPPFLALTRSILYQQLADKAGTSIYTKFVELCGGENGVIPDTILSLSELQLKQIGVSGRKTMYLYDLANKYKTGILSDNSIVGLDDKSLFTMLTMVKGFGSWSVHMFMIFSLHRPDVLPTGDLGVRKGVQLLYGFEELPKPSQMEQICNKWRPYRSVGAWYMWRSAERKGVPQAGSVVGLGGSMSLQQQMEQRQQQTHQQHHIQMLEPINAIAGLGGCIIWGQ